MFTDLMFAYHVKFLLTLKAQIIFRPQTQVLIQLTLQLYLVQVKAETSSTHLLVP